MPDNELNLEGLVIETENILVSAHASNSEEIIRQLGSLLFENGFVKDTYIQAVLDREKIYPTGLQIPSLGFAIPHTDIEHVNKPAVAIATLEKPVSFRAMDNPEAEIPVNIVMMLAISDPKSVVNVLRKVISILEDEPALLILLKATTKEEIKQAVYMHIRSMVDMSSKDKSVDFSH
jgi:PTS system galactitol-specific IIA component